MSTILAQGSKQVQALETALGGHPPAAAIKQSQSALAEYVRAYSERKYADRERFKSVAAKSRDRLLSSLNKDDPGLAKDIAAAKELYKAQASRPLAKPKPKSYPVEPRFVAGSQFELKAPPFDVEWTSGSVAHADKNSGTYDLAVQSIGNGSFDTAAGVGVWFWSLEADAEKRFAVVLDYAYDWWDSAGFYVAHNDLRTRLWVWGNQEQNWVGGVDRDPQWSDGVGWLEDHSGNDEARISIEVRFPALAQSWYLAWVWSDASVFSDSGAFGVSASSIHASASIPIMVLGQLF